MLSASDDDSAFPMVVGLLRTVRQLLKLNIVAPSDAKLRPAIQHCYISLITFKKSKRVWR